MHKIHLGDAYTAQGHKSRYELEKTNYGPWGVWVTIDPEKAFGPPPLRVPEDAWRNIKINGQSFSFVASMIPWKETFNDEEIAAVLTYVRQEWGNKAPM